MKKLDKEELIKSAEAFCKQESGKYRKELFGVTDGKAIGTFVEHLFQDYLSISNALQWRLQYGRIVSLNETIDGISPIVKYDSEVDNE